MTDCCFVVLFEKISKRHKEELLRFFAFVGNQNQKRK